MTAPEHTSVFIGPGKGAALPILEIVHKVTAASVNGAFSTIEATLPPGAMIPPHTHSREDECNLVLAGALTCDVGGEFGIAPVGAYVVKPRGVTHTIANTGTVPVRFVEIHVPGAFERYYDEYEQIVAQELDEDQRRRARAALGERYGITWHDERIPAAMARFGLQP